MKIKSRIQSILILGVIASVALFESCQKYEDGPAISFRSRAERVANTWKIDNYKVNENDMTSLVTDYRETFSKDGNYSYTTGATAGTGSWTFQNDDKEIKLVGITNQEDHTLFILKLEEKEFWYYYMDGTDKHLFHLIKQ
jgi:hypothetical protein